MSKKTSYDFKYNILLALLSGFILGFSFPPFQFGAIALIGFVPLFILFESIEKGRKAFRYSYFTFFVFNLIACYWVGGFGYEVDIFLMISGVALTLLHPLFFTVPMMAFYYIRKNLGQKTAFFSLPFVWIAFEYLHSITEFSYPWLILGNSQTYNIYNIQYITFTGVYGISFWIITINILIYFTYTQLINDRLSFSSLKSYLIPVTLILLYFLPGVISRFILTDYNYTKKKIKIAMIQPDVDPWDKWKKNKEFDQVIELLNMTKKVVNEHRPDLVVWPETAIPFYLKLPSRSVEMQTIKKTVDSLNVNLISGVADLKIYGPGDVVPPSSKKGKSSEVAWDSYNSIFLFQPNQNDIQVYHKIKLVPFSERIPYLDSYPFLVHFLEWGVGISNWGIGKDSTIFHLPGKSTYNLTGENNSSITGSSETRFWAMVCYESIFPGFVSEFAKKGAQFFIIVTNDSWFGNSSGPYQHNQFAVLRAIENRRSIARCANGGISSIIDPTGRILAKTKFDTKDMVVSDLELSNEETFYSRHGDLFSKICMYITLLVIFSTIVKKIAIFNNKISRKKNEHGN